MIDQYYTPEHIASNLLISLEGKNVKNIADFAVGDGSLIKKLPFKAKNIIGLDIDSSVISRLQRSNPKWKLKSGDFLNPDEPTRRWLHKYYKKLNLIILNPPFSCKGKKNITLKVSENEAITFRPYLAFVFKSLQYLDKKGVLIAILPLSCIKSDIDNIALSYISKYWDISLGEKLGRNVFKGCSPSSIVLTISPKISVTKHRDLLNGFKKPMFNAQILRGSTQMHNTKDDGIYPVLHTYNIRQNKIVNQTKFSNIKIKYAKGYYLCVPRVCLPNKEKIVLIENESYVLSDCLIGIKGECIEQTIFIKTVILDNWDKFKSLYESTCAPYITINQLKDFLFSMGISSHTVSSFEDDFNYDEWENPRANLPIKAAENIAITA